MPAGNFHMPRTSPQPAPEPDFAMPGFKALPPPSECTPETLLGQLVAHRFHNWDGGWAVGTVDAQSTHKRALGAWEVSYAGFKEVYLHMLRASDYGVSKNWVLVKATQ